MHQALLVFQCATEGDPGAAGRRSVHVLPEHHEREAAALHRHTEDAGVLNEEFVEAYGDRVPELRTNRRPVEDPVSI